MSGWKLCVALGLPGFGKSLLLQDMAADACVDGWTCFVIDRAGEWAALDSEGRPNPRWRGDAPNIVDAPEPPTTEEELDKLTDWLCELRDADVGSVVRFGFPWTAYDVATLVTDVGDVVYVDDEIDELAGVGDWTKKEPPHPLRLMVHRGRHLPDRDGVPRVTPVFGALRRPQNAHVDLFSMATEVFVFRCKGKRTLDRLEEEDVISREERSRVRLQEKFCYLKWTVETSQWGRLLEPKWTESD